MSAVTEVAQEESRMQRLAAELRSSASDMAVRAGGGFALIFAATDDVRSSVGLRC